jgi:MoaD family protein
VVVKLFAALRDLAGESEVEVGAPVCADPQARPPADPQASPSADLQASPDGPCATLGELLEALAARYGPAFRRAVLDGERLRPAVVVLINGHNARFAGELDAPLARHDEVAIFPPLGGG